MENTIANVNLRDQIYEIIRGMILRREIGPGEKIVEENLAKKIGVSRTPLREVLFRLESEGIVQIIPRRGAFIREKSKEQIIEVLEIREVLEGLVTRLASNNIDNATLKEIKTKLASIKDIPDEEANLIKFTLADEEFHAHLLNACHNDMLKNIIGTINMHLQFIRLRTVVLPGRAKRTISEHYDIVTAIENKDAKKAEKLMRKHIASVRDFAIRNIHKMV